LPPVSAPVTKINRERAVLLTIWLLAAAGCLVGAAPLPRGGHPGLAEQALDLVRVVTTLALVVVLVLGPGLALRVGHARRRRELGFVPLPGLALLVACGTIAWAVTAYVTPHPRIVCTLLIVPVLAWILIRTVRARDQELLDPEETRALLIVGAALGIAVARALWSLGPIGELNGGTVFRALDVGDRSDPVISYHLVQLLFQGASPFGALSRALFDPYTFSDRGPLSGLASAPLVLLSGGRPPVSLGVVVAHTGKHIDTAPWLPFDPEGFMAYRLAMMAFASTAFLSLWTLTRKLGGVRAARIAVLLAAASPFLVHEIWFTWPKLLAVSFVLLAAVRLFDQRALSAGLLVGIGYLVHPLALLSLPALVLLAAWPLAGAHLRAPHVRSVLMILAGTAVGLIAWRVVNGSHYTQSNFVDYLTRAGRTPLFLAGIAPPVTIGSWLSARLLSVANTLVPMRLFFLSGNDQSINTVYQACFPLCSRGGSPGVVHFFFQYWTTLPFGVGIVFFPFLLQSMWRAIKWCTWGVTAAVIVPFVLFALYWGDATTGLLREGLHAWVLTLFVVIALQQQHDGFPWFRNNVLRALLAMRPAEVVLLVLVPTVATTHRLIASRFALIDAVAILAIVALAGALGICTWRERAGRQAEPALP
jgi:hypothetical protein